MIIRFVDPIYGSKVELRTCTDCQYDDGDARNRDGGVDKMRRILGNKAWIYYRVNVQNPADYCLLAHECLHLVRMIFEHHCVKFVGENDEAIAYHQEYWMRKFLDAVKKQDKKWNKFLKPVIKQDG